MILIGQGETGHVYHIGHGRVMKLLHDPEYVEYEYKACKYIGDKTPFAPQVFKRVTYEGKEGYEMQEVVGELLIDVINECDLAYYGDLMGLHHRKLHEWDASELNLPNLAEVMAKHIRMLKHFSDEEKTFCLNLLNTLPKGQALLHGDYMPYNLMYLDDKLSALDWSDAMLGPAEADIARTLYFILDPTDYEDAYFTLNANKFIEAYFCGYYGNKTTMGIIKKWLFLNVIFEYDNMLSEDINNDFVKRLRTYILRNMKDMDSDSLF